MARRALCGDHAVRLEVALLEPAGHLARVSVRVRVRVRVRVKVRVRFSSNQPATWPG